MTMHKLKNASGPINLLIVALVQQFGSGHIREFGLDKLTPMFSQPDARSPAILPR
jgi:hypothetical protein